MSLLLATSASVTPCELPFGGCCRRMGNSIGHRTHSITTLHASVVLRGGDVTQSIYESRMNWIIDPTPPAYAVNTPPSEARPKLPGRSRRRRRRKKKATATANDNSAPRTADVTAPAA